MFYIVEVLRMGCLTMDAFSERARTCHQKRGGVGIFVHIPVHSTWGVSASASDGVVAGVFSFIVYMC